MVGLQITILSLSRHRTLLSDTSSHGASSRVQGWDFAKMVALEQTYKSCLIMFSIQSTICFHTLRIHYDTTMVDFCKEKTTSLSMHWTLVKHRLHVCAGTLEWSDVSYCRNQPSHCRKYPFIRINGHEDTWSADTAARMPGIIVKDVHRTKQRINTTCDGINLLSFFPAKVETQGGGGGVNMELITPSWE